MKSSNNNPTHKKKKSGYFFLIIILISILAFFTITESITLNLTKKDILNQYEIQDRSGKTDHTPDSKEIIDMLREKSYLAGRIEMARSDSISLVVSLVDSVLRLELKGVIIHKAPIIKYSKSPVFEISDQFAISNLLSSPGKVISFDGTLPKEPIMIKTAPKDSAEASIPDIVPDTSKIEPVFYTLRLDNGIRINVSEINSENSSNRNAGLIFNSKEYLADLWDDAFKLVQGKRPANHLYIHVKVDARDGRIIYRALPYNARVTVRL